LLRIDLQRVDNKTADKKTGNNELTFSHTSTRQ
jgi:hypothetical protein